MLNLGTQEGFTVEDGRFASVWPHCRAVFIALRKLGTPVGISIDPLTGHQCGDQRYLAIPWFDACLTKRLPDAPGSSMKPIAGESHWLARLPSPDSPQELKTYAAAAYEGDPLEAVWLPSQEIAEAWTTYGTGKGIADRTPPPKPGRLRIDGARLKWDAAADLQSGLAYFIVQRNGRPVANVPEKPTNPYGRPIAQGLLYSDTPEMPLKEFYFDGLVDGATTVDEYAVIAVNTVGLQSESSDVLRVDTSVLTADQPR